MTALPQESSMELDISEWKRLQSLTERETIKAEISNKIKFLEAQCFNKQKPFQTPATSEIFSTITNFAWDQTTEYIKIYVTLDKATEIPNESIDIKYQPTSLDLKIRGVAKCPNSRLLIKEFQKAIDPNGSKFKIRKNTITLTLKKKELLWWSDIKPTELKQPKMGAPSADDEKDPGASMMKLMKQLYQEGDDDMKRTIAKAWTESEDKRNSGMDPMAFM